MLDRLTQNPQSPPWYTIVTSQENPCLTFDPRNVPYSLYPNDAMSLLMIYRGN